MVGKQVLQNKGKNTEQSRRKFSRLDMVLVLMAAVVMFWFLTGSPVEEVFSGGKSSASAEELLAGIPQTELTMALLAIPTRESNEYPAYTRDEFGVRWADVDHNGCDTRNDILSRDLLGVTYKPGTNDCVVVTGKLDDPYTGKQIDFRRGENTSSMVQIDHVVALADAWKAGAWQWSAVDREQFANDPLNLLAVDGPANTQKSASTADQWLPSNTDFQCEYVARQIGVKSKWDLSVSEEEKKAMAATIVECPGQKLPADLR